MRFYSLLLTPSRILRVGIVLGAISYNSGWPQRSKFDIDMLRRPEKTKYLFNTDWRNLCYVTSGFRKCWVNVALPSLRNPNFFSVACWESRSVSGFRGDEREELLVPLGNHATFSFLKDFRDFNLILLLFKSRFPKVYLLEKFTDSFFKTTSKTQIISGGFRIIFHSSWFRSSWFRCKIQSKQKKTGKKHVITDHRSERHPGLWFEVSGEVEDYRWF